MEHTPPPATTPTPDDSPTELEPVADAVAELREILRELRRQRIAIITLAVALIAGGLVGYLDLSGKAADAALNREALCALRADLQANVDQSKDFLIEHPGGFADVPAAEIQKAIDDKERTIETLAPLPCPTARPSKRRAVTP